MAMKEISSQSAIDHKERRTTLTYMVSVCFLCVYLNMAIGSSKLILAISFTMLLAIRIQKLHFIT